MTESRIDQVFLSYASENEDIARKVYEGLVKRDVEVWFDKEDLGPGKWKDKVLKAITRSRYFIILISEAALRKTGDEPGFQDKELNRAYNIAEDQPDDEFTIIPVRIEDCDRGDHRLTSFQQYDLYDDFEEGLDTIAVDIGGKSLSDAKAKDERTEDEKMAARLMGKAETTYYAGDYNLAITVCDTVIAFNPDYADAWGSKGASLNNLGRYDEALEATEKAIELKPDFTVAWHNKSAVLNVLDRYDEALVASEKAIELIPDFAKAWSNKGVALIGLNRYDEALEAAEKAIDIQPDDAVGWVCKGIALSRFGRYDEALAASEKAL